MRDASTITLVGDLEREVRAHLDDNDVDGIRADVDGGRAHGEDPWR